MKKVLWFIVCLMAMAFTSCDITTDCVVCGDEAESGSIYCYRHQNYLESTYGNTSSRCSATTKDGKRCKRQAEKGSIYCWQHKYNH